MNYRNSKLFNDIKTLNQRIKLTQMTNSSNRIRMNAAEVYQLANAKSAQLRSLRDKERQELLDSKTKTYALVSDYYMENKKTFFGRIRNWWHNVPAFERHLTKKEVHDKLMDIGNISNDAMYYKAMGHTYNKRIKSIQKFCKPFSAEHYRRMNNEEIYITQTEWEDIQYETETSYKY